MIYVYKKNGEMLLLDNELSEAEMLRNQLSFEGKITEEFYDGLVKATSTLIDNLATALTEFEYDKE